MIEIEMKNRGNTCTCLGAALCIEQMNPNIPISSLCMCYKVMKGTKKIGHFKVKVYSMYGLLKYRCKQLECQRQKKV